jgi:hypothetical protein
VCSQRILRGILGLIAENTELTLETHNWEALMTDGAAQPIESRILYNNNISWTKFVVIEQAGVYQV